MDYLLGKDRDREKAKVLSGDPDETVALIDASHYAKSTLRAFCRLRNGILAMNKSVR